MKVRDIMHRRVARILPDAPVAELIQLLARESISAAPVVDAHGQLIGVASMRDVIAVLAQALDDSSESINALLTVRQVKDIMTLMVVTVAADTSVVELATTLQREGLHRAFVVEKGKLRGVVSTFDVLGAAAQAG